MYSTLACKCEAPMQRLCLLPLQTCLEALSTLPTCCAEHACLTSPVLLQALVRLSFGIDAARSVAMKLVVRSDSPDASQAIHQIIQDA